MHISLGGNFRKSGEVGARRIDIRFPSELGNLILRRELENQGIYYFAIRHQLSKVSEKDVFFAIGVTEKCQGIFKDTLGVQAIFVA